MLIAVQQYFPGTTNYLTTLALREGGYIRDQWHVIIHLKHLLQQESGNIPNGVSSLPQGFQGMQLLFILYSHHANSNITKGTGNHPPPSSNRSKINYVYQSGTCLGWCQCRWYDWLLLSCIPWWQRDPQHQDPIQHTSNQPQPEMLSTNLTAR